ncbi:MAG: hypothetical protein DRG87_03845 [Deltaproteobacteria bacterium]|nr:MAG: hypothetical protein DRG87_03845 [Deltaproteobacteria bacterium]
MRIAITTHNGRVSPLFDSASRFLVAELDMNRECSRFEAAISEPFLYSKVMRLRELGAETLICGAISEQGASMITTAGVELIPWISGQVEEVLQAFLVSIKALGAQVIISCGVDGLFMSGLSGLRGFF